MNYECLHDYIRDIKEKLLNGITPEKTNVRILLDKLEVSRRGTNVNACINEILDKFELRIEPDFEWVYVYNDLILKQKSTQIDIDTISKYRIDGLESANNPPLSVQRNDELSKAITIMLSRNFSQLPVMRNDRDVEGIISWKSISTKMVFSCKEKLVKDYLEKAVIIDDDTSLFEAIDIVGINDYVIIRSTKDRKIKGIVTSSDLSEQFKNLSEPFLLIGKCELLLRKIIHGKFSLEELVSAKNPVDDNRKVNSIHDLTFGEYIRLIENRENWEKLELNLDRKMIIDQLGKIRDIRNDVMHFDPNTKDGEELNEIKSLNSIFEQILKNKGSV